MTDQPKLFRDNAEWSMADVIIEKMEVKPRDDFDCEREEQNEYLLRHAETDQRLGVAVTYLLLVKGEQAGFVTITMDEIALFPFERPAEARYSRLPAVKLAQMGVHKDFAGQGVGKVLVSFVIHKAIELSLEIGCRFVTLDSKTDLVDWYKEQGFRINKLDQKERKAAAVPGADLPVSMRIDLHGLH